ncbi:hypothetical protein OF001_U440005 [Pseudomonas sp. OF001]|nr:hypothetical protein OF001_U440005 [Pseudomonas sp. OF001]
MAGPNRHTNSSSMSARFMRWPELRTRSVMARLCQCNCGLDGRTRLRTVLPAGGSDDSRGLGNDVQRIRLAQLSKRREPHLLKASNYRGANALYAQQGLTFFR